MIKSDNCLVSKYNGPAMHTNRYTYMHAGLHHHSSSSSSCRAVQMVARRAWKCGLTIEAAAAAQVVEFAV